MLDPWSWLGRDVACRLLCVGKVGTWYRPVEPSAPSAPGAPSSGRVSGRLPSLLTRLQVRGAQCSTLAKWASGPSTPSRRLRRSVRFFSLQGASVNGHSWCDPKPSCRTSVSMSLAGGPKGTLQGITSVHGARGGAMGKWPVGPASSFTCQCASALLPYLAVARYVQGTSYHLAGRQGRQGRPAPPRQGTGAPRQGTGAPGAPLAPQSTAPKR